MDSLGSNAAASYRYGGSGTGATATSDGGQESLRLVVLRDDAACSPQPDSNRTRQVVHGMQPLRFDVPSNSSAASLFYASLQHSSGAWYGCYLKWTDSNALRCHGSENLVVHQHEACHAESACKTMHCSTTPLSCGGHFLEPFNGASHGAAQHRVLTRG